ncbi:MAG: hypothetical protein AAF481_10880 [Acidobacteriota bacterium]
MSPSEPATDGALPSVPAPGDLTVRVNAFSGDLAKTEGTFAPTWRRWALGEEAGAHEPSMLAPEEEPILTRWQDPRVGWGVVLPLDLEEADVPAPIRRLIASRQTDLGRVPVLRPFPKDDPNALILLKDLDANNAPTIDGSGLGVAIGSIPAYLLIVGSPEEISWELQEVLSQSGRFVGRLDLGETGLKRYIDHLLHDWSGSSARLDQTVTWAVRHNADDITATLRSVLTRPLHKKLAGDSDIGTGAVFLDGKESEVTGSDLRDALADQRPLLVATSSHGQTAPLDDRDTLRRDLGLPVGQDLELLDVADLLSHWQPDGAVWFCHACCSAGCKAESAYRDLFPTDGPIAEVLDGVAGLGNVTAPLPRALLGAEKPLRAFIGQVEPTFDWTLKQPETGQKLATTLIKPLYERLYLKKPVGMTLADWHRRSASLNDAWIKMRQDIRDGGTPTTAMLYPRLAAADVASTVLLGDPTAFFA